MLYFFFSRLKKYVLPYRVLFFFPVFFLRFNINITYTELFGGFVGNSVGIGVVVIIVLGVDDILFVVGGVFDGVFIFFQSMPLVPFLIF